MMKLLLLVLIVGAFAQYTPDWTSIDKRPIPQWYQDAKFGIFIHWGVYSIPAFGSPGVYAEWYGYYINIFNSSAQQFHNKTYGPDFKYTEFADQWKAELWDPDQWADLFVRAGAKYIVPTSKHHEGFTLWPSPQSWNWNAVDIGPKRNLLADMFTAFRARDLHACLYYSLYEWYNPLLYGSDPSLYVSQVMLPQLYDLANNSLYQPDLIWTDGEWTEPSSFWRSTEFLAWLFNDSPNKDNVVIDDRWGNETRGVHGGFYTAEYSVQVWLNRTWEQNSGVDVFSYGLNRVTDADHYFSAEYLVNLLTRSVANGGNFLLDVGPHPDGTIPPIAQERLLQIGGWLDVNGEAIYGSRFWREQNDFIFPDEVSYTYVNLSTTVFGICTAHGGNCSTASIKMVALTESYEECEAYCTKDDTCLSYSWYWEANQDAIQYACFIRTAYDDGWSPMRSYAAISARKTHWVIDYTSQNPDVYDEPAIYAIVHPWPTTSFVLPAPLASSNTTVTLLGYNETIHFTSAAGAPGITLTIPDLTPDQMPCDYSYTFKILGAK